MQLELRLAGARLTPQGLAALLLELRVAAMVVPGTQVVPGEGLQAAATVHLFDCDKTRLVEHVWPALRDAFELSCAYVSTYDRGFHGCLLNYAAPSACPLARRAPEILALSPGLARWAADELTVTAPGWSAAVVRAGPLSVALDGRLAAWTLAAAAPPPARLLPAPPPCRAWLLPLAEDDLDLEAARRPGRPADVVMPPCAEADVVDLAQLPPGAETWHEPPHYVFEHPAGAWGGALAGGTARLCYQGGARLPGAAVGHWLRWEQRAQPVHVVFAGGEPVALRRALGPALQLRTCPAPEGRRVEVDGLDVGRVPDGDLQLLLHCPPASVGQSLQLA